MAIEAEIGLLKQPQLHRLMRPILNRVLIWAIDRLALEFVLGLWRLFCPVNLLDQMALRAGHPFQRRVTGLGLIDKELDVFGEFSYVRCMAAKTLGFIFSCWR